MKKFLTVLLALSVVFTYTVGTAFAADEVTYSYDQMKTEIEKAANDAITDSEDAMDGALGDLNNMNQTGNGGIQCSKEAFKVVYTDYNAANTKAVKKALDIALTNLSNDYVANTEKIYTASELNAYTSAFTTLEKSAFATYVTTTNEGQRAVHEAELELVQADMVAELNAIDLSVYSTKVDKGETKSNYAKALAVVNKALTLVKNYDTDADFYDLIAAINNINAIYTAPVGLGDPAGAIWNGETVDGIDFSITISGVKKAMKDLPTISSEVVEGNKLEYAQNKTITEITKEINADKEVKVDELQAKIFVESQKSKPNTTRIDGWKEDIADIESAATDAIEVLTYLVKDADNYRDLGAFDEDNKWTGTTWEYTVATEFTDGKVTMDSDHFTVAEAVTRCALVEKAKKNAELAKAEIEIDGATFVEIDVALEKAIDAIYKGKQTHANLPAFTAYAYLYNYVENILIDKDAENDPVEIDGKKYADITEWEASLDQYDEEMKDDVEAIVADAKDAVRAAGTIAEAKATFLDAYAKYDAIPTAVEHSADFNLITGANHAKYEQVKKELAAYAAAKIASLQKLGTLDLYAAGADADLKELVNYYNNPTEGKFFTDCFTAEDLNAKLAEAKKLVDDLKTNKEIVAAQEAIEKEIAALATTADLADKAAVMSAYDKMVAHNEYCDLVVSTDKVSYSKVTELAKAMKKAEAKNLDDAYDAIWKDGEVTLDEKVAVEALRAAYDEFVEFWDEYPATFGNNPTVTDAQIGTDETTIENLEVEAVMLMIAKLPADGSDVAGIKAAKDAYEELSRKGQYDVYVSKYYDKLVDLQKLLVKNVESLKVVKNHSVAGKGYIKLAWSTKGNAAGVDGYQIYRSVKKNSGFGTKPIFTTANKTYKNTKSLKKGTRYYYKVRAFVELNGQKYYSDWSNKAYRVAK